MLAVSHELLLTQILCDQNQIHGLQTDLMNIQMPAILVEHSGWLSNYRRHMYYNYHCIFIHYIFVDIFHHHRTT